MSKLKTWKIRYETDWKHPSAVRHIMNHGWIFKWKGGGGEVVGCGGTHIVYAEFEYGYLSFRKRVLLHYKKGWGKMMRELYGEDYE